MLGQCSSSKGVEYGTSISDQTCGQKVTLSNNAGTINLSNSILDGTSLTTDLQLKGSATNTISITAGNIWNVEMNADTSQATHRAITKTTGTFAAPSITAGATCDFNNILKEIHYTAIVKYSNNTEVAQTIESVTANVVYVDFKGYPCDSTMMYSQIYSFEFKESTLS